MLLRAWWWPYRWGHSVPNYVDVYEEKKKYIYNIMEDNQLLIIVFAFILGYLASGIMKNMCGCRLLEGNKNPTTINVSCTPKYRAKDIDGIQKSTILTCSTILQNYDKIDSECKKHCDNELKGASADYCEPISTQNPN